MGADGAVGILYGKKMKAMNDMERTAFRQEKIDEYNEAFMTPHVAAAQGYVDEIIKPEATRERIYGDLLMLSNKKSSMAISKKHDNIPL